MLTKEKLKPKKRDLRNFNQELFFKKVKEQNFEQKIKDIADLNSKYEFVHDNIMKIIEKHAPMKNVSDKELKKRESLGLLQEFFN